MTDEEIRAYKKYVEMVDEAHLKYIGVPKAFLEELVHTIQTLREELREERRKGQEAPRVDRGVSGNSPRPRGTNRNRTMKRGN